MTEQHEAPSGVSGRALQKDIPQATVARLATYLRVLAMLADDGVAIVSSEELAVAAGVNSAKLRKDLSFLGPNGVRGVGYDVAKLRTRIEDVLGLSQGHRVVLVGAGNLGRADRSKAANLHGEQRYQARHRQGGIGALDE